MHTGQDFSMIFQSALLLKNNYYESSTLNAKKGPMKTAAQNRSANSDWSVIARGPTFSLVNALVYVEHRPGHSLGKKEALDLQCSRRSWLSVFTHWFSWVTF